MIREIKIRKTNGGFIVKIGCQEFVATDSNKILEGLKDYFENQSKAEKKYVEINLLHEEAMPDGERPVARNYNETMRAR